MGLLCRCLALRDSQSRLLRQRGERPPPAQSAQSTNATPESLCLLQQLPKTCKSTSIWSMLCRQFPDSVLVISIAGHQDLAQTTPPGFSQAGISLFCSAPTSARSGGCQLHHVLILRYLPRAQVGATLAPAHQARRIISSARAVCIPTAHKQCTVTHALQTCVTIADLSRLPSKTPSEYVGCCAGFHRDRATDCTEGTVASEERG